MDANDAASYVQDLAGDNANIIFGAKYDETMQDEATITVIATGLEDAKPVSASTIQSRMIYNTPAGTTTAPKTATVSTQPTAGLHTTQQTARPTATQASAPTPGFGINKPEKPEPSIKPVEIQIPDFLKNSRR